MNNKGISNLWVEFIIIKEDGVSVCGLCENSGHIQTKAGSAFCICPNGRVYKTRLFHRPKWGASSIINNK